MNQKLQPTLHKPVPLQTRVIVDSQYLGSPVKGIVGGVAYQHVVFGYIVILDEPHLHQGEVHTAIVVLGSHLRNDAGEAEWFLNPKDYGYG